MLCALVRDGQSRGRALLIRRWRLLAVGLVSRFHTVAARCDVRGRNDRALLSCKWTFADAGDDLQWLKLPMARKPARPYYVSVLCNSGRSVWLQVAELVVQASPLTYQSARLVQWLNDYRIAKRNDPRCSRDHFVRVIQCTAAFTCAHVRLTITFAPPHFELCKCGSLLGPGARPPLRAARRAGPAS